MVASRPLRRVSSRGLLQAQSKAARTPQHRSLSKVEIPDSDDLLDTISVNTSTTSRNAQLKEVAIPMLKPGKRQMPNRTTSVVSRSPSTVGDSIEDEGSDYETPVTSAAVTPAESVGRGSSLKSGKSVRVNATDRVLELQQSQYALSRPPNNKKRLATAMASNGFSDSEDNRDMKLARKLQAEEYEAFSDFFPSTKRRKASQPMPRQQVFGTDDSSLDDLSDLPSSDYESDDDVPIATTRRVAARRGRRLSRRQPTQGKGKATAKETVPTVVDSEDDSDLSSLPEDSLMQDAEESQFENTSESEEDQVTEPSVIQSAASEDDGPVQRGSVRRNVRFRQRPQRGRQRPSGLSGKARERLRLEKAHPSVKTMWKDLEQVPVIKPIAGEQPASISRKLKSFQLEGVDWMIKQESTEYKGGLLGGKCSRCGVHSVFDDVCVSKCS